MIWYKAKYFYLTLIDQIVSVWIIIINEVCVCSSCRSLK